MCTSLRINGSDSVSYLHDFFAKNSLTPCYLSKSDFKMAQTCPTKLYYKKLGYPSTRDTDRYFQFLADGGYMVETIAKPIRKLIAA
jgi:hypothetical protein